MRLLLMSAILMAAAIALADEDPGRVPRVWGLKEEGEITATYAGREGDHIALRLKDGSTRKVHLWRVNAKDLAYLQRQQCGHFELAGSTIERTKTSRPVHRAHLHPGQTYPLQMDLPDHPFLAADQQDWVWGRPGAPGAR